MNTTQNTFCPGGPDPFLGPSVFRTCVTVVFGIARTTLDPGNASLVCPLKRVSIWELVRFCPTITGVNLEEVVAMRIIARKYSVRKDQYLIFVYSMLIVKPTIFATHQNSLLCRSITREFYIMGNYLSIRRDDYPYLEQFSLPTQQQAPESRK